MLELEEAQKRILSAITPLGTEEVALRNAAGRVAAERLLAPIDLPIFDNSAMDGYAVRAEDLVAATPEHPVGLRLIGKVAAGETFSGKVERGTCVRLFTGSPLPRGADSVVMQEDTRCEPERPEAVWFLDRPKPWENVRLQGEDLKRETVVVEAGSWLTVGRVGLLAALGLAKVSAGQKPVAGLLATGNELREAGEPLAPGQIYESNRAMLAALITRAGATPRHYPLVQDTLAGTRAALELAFSECDAVVTCGGVSVGEFDQVKLAFEQAGGQLEFWRVAIKPGKPFVFGQRAGKFLFGLPGNPASAMVTFLLLARPALARLQGAVEVGLPAHPGELGQALVNEGDRRHFIRVTVDRDGKVLPAGIQASHRLESMAKANGLVDVPPHTTLAAGSKVQVIRWD